MKTTMFIRLYAEVADADAATTVAGLVRAKIVRYGSIRQENVERYWKIPAYFGIYLVFEPTGDAATTFGDLMAEMGTGWEVLHPGDPGQWAVWNPDPAATFFVPEVRWANLECVE